MCQLIFIDTFLQEKNNRKFLKFIFVKTGAAFSSTFQAFCHQTAVLSFLSSFLQQLGKMNKKHITQIAVAKRGKTHPIIAFVRVFGINSMWE